MQQYSFISAHMHSGHQCAVGQPYTSRQLTTSRTPKWIFCLLFQGNKGVVMSYGRWKSTASRHRRPQLESAPTPQPSLRRGDHAVDPFVRRYTIRLTLRMLDEVWPQLRLSMQDGRASDPNVCIYGIYSILSKETRVSQWRLRMLNI